MCACVKPLFAQQYTFKKLGADEGLTVNTVHKVVQDKQGFIWIATMDGLNRFDGYSVIQYRSKSDSSGIIPHNDVYNLFCDDAGYLWISTVNGALVRYHPGQRIKQSFKQGASGNALPLSIVRDFAQTDQKGVWLSLRKGLFWFDKASGEITGTDTALFGSSIIYRLLAKDDHTLWLATDKGLFVFNTKLRKIIARTLLAKAITELAEWREGYTLAGAQDGLHLLDVSLKEFPLKESMQQFRIRSILTDRNRQVWISALEGLVKYDLLEGKYVVFKHNEYDQRTLSSNAVNGLYEDRSGTVWIASVNGGANYVDPQGTGFNTLRSPMDGVAFNNVILGICEDPLGNIWFANADGLGYWNRKNHTVSIIPHKDRKADALPENATTRSVCMDQQGALWVGLGGKGVVRWDEQRRRFRNYMTDTNDRKNSLANNFVFDIHCTREGEIWCATGVGMSRYDRQHDKMISFEGHPVLNEIAKKRIWKISDDSKGNLWFATPHSGAYCWNRKTDKVIHYQVNKEHPEKGIVFDAVWCVSEDKLGNYWVCTTNGLSRIDAVSQQITHYTTDNGLPNNNIYGMLCDAGGDLWMSSNGGIIKYETAAGKFKNYTVSDGVQSNEFNQEAFCESNITGEFFFGGIKGFNYFDPLSIKDDHVPPVAFLGDVFTHNEGEMIPLLSDQDSPIRLNYQQDFVSFNFASDDYYHNGQCRFKYVMEGVNDHWVDAGNSRNATYSNLKPGTYKFSVVASSNGVDWSEKAAQITLVIDPPYWGTWWFQLLLLIIIPGVIVLAIRRRFDTIRNKARIAEEVAELKMQALRAQMNPHFIFNALNSIQHLVVKAESDLAFSYLSKFSRLLRMILDVSDMTFVSLEKEIEMIRLYLDLEALRFDQHMQYHIEADEDISGLSIPTLLIQPYVENAIWHGLVPKQGHRELSIKITADDHYLRIIIEDNGIGRKKAGEMKSMQPIRYESKGMSINSDRLGILGPGEKGAIELIDLYDDLGNASGTRVKIILPIKALINRKL
jgi:ligand-binding sensor domain-containing protein